MLTIYRSISLHIFVLMRSYGWFFSLHAGVQRTGRTWNTYVDPHSLIAEGSVYGRLLLGPLLPCWAWWWSPFVLNKPDPFLGTMDQHIRRLWDGDHPRRLDLHHLVSHLRVAGPHVGLHPVWLLQEVRARITKPSNDVVMQNCIRSLVVMQARR